MTGPFLPLSGIRVLDCSRVLAGPFATMLLADLGADVVKLEPPGGDETRGWGPPWWGEPGDRRSAYFASVNRNKRSLVLDLRTDDGRRLLDRLASGADLLVHNAPPASAERLGLGPERLRAAHPDLVVAVLGGFGGRQAERPAYDLLAQAVSGFMAVTGEPDGPPQKAGVAVLDLLAGLELAVGSLAALIGRSRAGDAPEVRVNLVEASVASLLNVLANHLAGGDDSARWGTAHPNIVPYQAFAARDGHVALAVGNDRQFARLLEVLGIVPDARFATNPDRVAHRDELVAALAAVIAERGRDELVAALTDAGVPAGPVLGVGEALADVEATHGPGWVQEGDGMRLAPDPVRFDDVLLPMRRPPPRLGEHSDEILREAGVAAAELARLREAGVVG